MGEPSDVARALIGALNRNDLAALDGLLAQEFVDRSPDPGQGSSRESFLSDKLGRLRSAFEDLVISIDDELVAGDRICFRWTLRGTNTGPFAGHDPTGIAVTFGGINIERIVDGRIVEHWSVHDSLDLFHQLGFLPG